SAGAAADVQHAAGAQLRGDGGVGVQVGAVRVEHVVQRGQPGVGELAGGEGVDLWQGGDRLHLHELAGVAEHRHAEQRGGHVVVAEGGPDHVPHGNQVGPVARGDQYASERDVAKARSAVGQSLGEVAHDGVGLGLVVALAYRSPRLVQRAGAGQEEQPVTGAGGGGVGVVG